MAGVVDTSVLFAALHEDDAHHEEAKARVGAHRGLEVPPAVLAELEMTIRKTAGRAVAIATVPAFLAQNPHLGVMDADLHPDALRIWKGHGGISYTDAYAIAGALLLGGDLVTLDHGQEAVWRKEKKARTG